MRKYVIYTTEGYVTSHRRGRMTKHLESARMFASHTRASTNKFMNQTNIRPIILEVDIEIKLS